MSDVIHGQVDEGVKMLLDIGGEVTQKRSYCRDEQTTTSALRHCLHEV